MATTRPETWQVRIGDADDYHEYDSLEAAANAVRDVVRATSETGPMMRYTGQYFYGIEIGQYRGTNGISFFVSDSDGYFVREATHGELIEAFGECGDLTCDCTGER